MINLNVDRLIDQLCAANHTNGQMMAELETARKELEVLREERLGMSKKIESLKEELKASQESVNYWFAEAKKNSPVDNSHE